MHALTPSRLTGISAILPFLACAIGLVFALQPPHSETVSQTEAEVAAAQLPATYLPVDAPLRAGLNGGRTQVSLTIAFVSHLPQSDLLSVSEQVKARQESVLASLTEILLAEATLNPDPIHLRRALPPLLRTATNEGLEVPDIPAPVSEVLILDLMISGG